MKTENMLTPNANRWSGRIDSMLEGAIFTTEFADAEFDIRIVSVDAAENRPTTQKTCKPTRNPCCKPHGTEPLAGHNSDVLDLLTV